MTQRSSRKVVFLHVSKTGGISFRRILRSLYKENFCVCQDPTIQGIEAALRKYDAVELHSVKTPERDFHLQGELLRQGRCDLLDDADVFTMLRDPVDQAISTYYHWVSKNRAIDPTYRSSTSTFPDSLEGFVDMPDGLNGQVANLVGKYWGMDGEKTREDLEMVKAMLLQKRVHVGLLERFPDSVRVFEKVTGRVIPDQAMPVENRNLNRPSLEEVPESLKQLIRERSPLDQELFDFGKKLFLDELATYGEQRPRQYAAWTLDPGGVAAWSRNALDRLFRGPLRAAILHDLDDNRSRHKMAANEVGLN